MVENDDFTGHSSVLPMIFRVVVGFYMNLVLFIQYIVNSVSVVYIHMHMHVLSERWLKGG